MKRGKDRASKVTGGTPKKNYRRKFKRGTSGLQGGNAPGGAKDLRGQASQSCQLCQRGDDVGAHARDKNA